MTQAEQHSEKESTVKPQGRRSRWLKWSLFLLLLLVFVPGVLLATGFGQRAALLLADKWIDGLSIGQVDGSLQDGLKLSNVQFQTDGVNVQAEQADLHIGFHCIWDKAACIENMVLKNAKIHIETDKLPPSSEPEKSREPIREINLPLALSLKNLAVDDLSLQVDDMRLHLDHFQSGLQAQGSDFQLLPTRVDGLQFVLPAQAVDSSEKSAKAKSDNAVDWQALRQQLAQPLLDKLSPIHLPLNMQISDFQASRIHIKQQVAGGDDISLLDVDKLQLRAHSNAEQISLEELSLTSDKGNLSGNGTLALAGDYPLDMQLHLDIPEFDELKLPASQVQLDLHGALLQTTELQLKTHGAVNAEVSGRVQLSEPNTPLALQISSKELRYPFGNDGGEKPLRLQHIDLQLTGDLLQYQLKSALDISGMGIPDSQVKLAGQGGLTSFELQDLRLDTLQGQANAKGKVDWEDCIAWQSDLSLNQINTTQFLPEWAAQLSGNLHTTGYAGRGEQGEQWAVKLDQMDLHGKLQNKPLRLQGELSSDHQQLLNVPGATLIYGENRIALKGLIDEQSDFSADIHAPNLAGLVPNLQANVNGQVRLQGKLSEPNLTLDVVAKQLAYEQFKLQHLSAKGNVAMAQEIQGDLELNVQQFQMADIRLEQAKMLVSGSEKNHRLTLNAKGEPVGANLQLDGHFDRQSLVWQGELSRVLVHTPVGELRNNKPIQIRYNDRALSADISAHCWQHSALDLCFPQQFTVGEEGVVPFDIKRFDLAMVQPYLDKNTQLSGVLNAKGDAQWFKNKAPQVNISVNSNAIKLVQQIENKTLPLTFSPVKVVANLANNQLKLNTDIKIDNNGRLSSELLLKDLSNTRSLSGHIDVTGGHLGIIKPLLSSSEYVNGDINARLTVGGSAMSPLLYGNLTLSELKARSTMMPFDVIGGHLAMNFNGATSTLKGNVKTKESNLLLEGDANWQKLDAWRTRVSAKAERFRVELPGMAKVDVSPNIEVRATPKELVLGGNIDIPWARIDVEELPESAVSVSGDEVIMDSQGKSHQKKALVLKNLPQTGSGMAIKADISINVGNDVKLDAYGLKTDLHGGIKVRQGNKGLGLYGQVNLKNGTFSSFGQDLVIRRGVISFTGSPTQPTLDIEAIRNPEAMEDPNVTAGVKVTGIADSPDVKIFSTPSMSQDQALSYILTGRGLENSGDAGSSNSIAAALIGMSLSKSSKMVGGIGSAFGISDLSVSTAGIGDNTKVVVSGSLAPKFKVKYGVGIFAPLTELTLRYRLAPSLYLQWMSSINQAVDLMYRFEFD